ncbi:MAG: hypothetical protein Q9169_003358 [Polycauliona sp. 2 TL-2023]
MVAGLGFNLWLLLQKRQCLLLAAFILVAVSTLIQQRSYIGGISNLGGIGFPTSPSIHSNDALTHFLQTVSTASASSIPDPLPASEFAEMGKRLQVLQNWIETSQDLTGRLSSEQATILRDNIDQTALAWFPFLRDPTETTDSSFSHLRNGFKPGSKGLVIPTGQRTFRYACHLVSNLRDVLGSKLPIEIVYAGDSDLPSSHRDFITGLGSDITTVDILHVFEDTSLDLQHAGWAIKTFAALGSQYGQIIVLDADAILLQAPETIFDGHRGYGSTGALLFHDRLLWQGRFKERHQWWEKQLEHHTPSKALTKSRVYNDGYAEECDSGLVALDKSRLPILLGLIHACWQNTKAVRDEWTYKMTYGDKESWWFGLELVGAEYIFEDHYGGMLGWFNAEKTKTCSFTIAHFDEQDKLLWYNGSLLKNKAKNATEFDVPTHYVFDGVWEKGATKPDVSCMTDGKRTDLSQEEGEILRKSIERAQDLDTRIIEQFTTLEG